MQKHKSVEPRRSRLIADDGAILVEFAVCLPVLLILFATAIESARMLWTYQLAVSGVRDAGRYIARVAPVDVCLTTGAGTMTTYATKLKNIVEKDISGEAIGVSGISINSVSSTLRCVTGTYRISPTPVVTVSANVSLSFPFGGVFGLVGDRLTSVDFDITDEARVYGQ